MRGPLALVAIAAAIAAATAAGCNTDTRALEEAQRAESPETSTFDESQAWVVQPGERYTSGKEQFSVAAPAGWYAAIELGAVTFTDRPGGKPGRNTIFVQPTAVEGEWVQKRTPDVLFPATGRALAALPGARVSPAQPAVRPGFATGVSFDVTFAPPGKRGRRYDRQHVVLVGGSGKRAFHVVHTAPAGELARTAPAFEAVLSSLKEEV